ncbi:hypothetical protein [Deefgea salmonis]|uniref:Uncharacterized protein n=1 Tax=Deefgea salmonis TaxID=2875502 RepID=A0ABS8BLC6_9NEIS|nr:hypothetical protein [Deefgea salmonis]MCB5196409.1 hypothetical protein [Deefgea salmonis]
MTKAQLFWYLRLIPRYSGILGIAGLALLGFALLLYTQELKPYQRDLIDRENALAHRFQQLRVSAVASSVSDALPKLNRSDTFTFFLRALNALAAKNQIVITQVDYKNQFEADGKLQRYSLQFPANARYMQIRRFMLELQTIPGVRIETVNLQRQQISDDQVALQIQLSYLTEAH